MTDLQDTLATTLGGSYTIERELGGGGMSRVFVATETALGRMVVVKVVAPDLAEGLSAERFTREVRLAARLQQANIVPLLSAGEADGMAYYTMPFVDGLSLRARLTSGGPMSIAEGTHVLRDVAKALAYAHAQGVIHRDIKPENVLLSGGTAMVTDFGIAKALTASRTSDGANTNTIAASATLTSVGSSLGTPAYMAPEQAVGSAVDLRADLYAWGVMAYEVLTGAHPFAGRTGAAQMIAAHIAEKPTPIEERNPAIPAPLASVVMRCLEKDPEERPASASELLTSLDTATTPTAALSSGQRVGAPATKTATSRWMLIGVGAAIVVLAGGAWLKSRRGVSLPAANSEKSLAVIPFESVGGDTANIYFAEGVADGLTIALAKLPGLHLAGHSSVAKFKGKGANAKEIGAALNVGAVLDGTVRRAGNQMRVTAQLTNAADGLVLWSDSYDREAKDVFALQDDITKQITSALRVRLSNGSTAASGIGTTNAEANDLYFRGLYLLRRRGTGLGQAADYFEQAIAKDSTFARAHAFLALVLLTQPYYMPVHIRDVLPRALTAANRAVALDSNLADAHMALGLARFHAFEFPRAEAELRRAAALDPNSAEVAYRLGFVLLTSGHVAESVPVLERAKANDPLYSLAAAHLGYAYTLTGNMAAGIVEGRRAVEIDSTIMVNKTLLSYSYRAAGRIDEALAVGRSLRTAADDPRLLGMAALILGKYGAPGESKPIIAAIEAFPPDAPRRNAGLTYAYLGIGDTARALSAIERAAATDGDLVFALVPSEESFDAVRGSARFAAVLKKLGFDVDLITHPIRK